MNINAGTLVVNGDITIVERRHRECGLLTGIGTASGVQVLTQAATFAPGTAHAGSSMTVASLTMQAGAFYSVNLSPSTSSQANVTGTADVQWRHGGGEITTVLSRSLIHHPDRGHRRRHVQSCRDLATSLQGFSQLRCQPRLSRSGPGPHTWERQPEQRSGRRYQITTTPPAASRRH